MASNVPNPRPPVRWAHRQERAARRGASGGFTFFCARAFGNACLASILLAGTTGCVERLLQVRSDPPGAHVYVDGKEVGTTPCDYEFSFYGTVDVTLRAPGYLSQRHRKTLPAPWYQFFPVDFFADLIVPWTIRDVHTLSVELEPSPAEVTPSERRQLEEKAEELRSLLPERASAPETGKS